ncbi:sigma-70 family RNA polymerase sigma factor [Dactylosporangium sp. NBC_01737]|uniref:sigma-70 family RNA polymerase sigma factor n=1 Tax=Dactylosporangium sp. NBC_01737 TaxID=2975959 RepID=UPI002E117115|nr:sigma-70 family RNA polymerase sigma factor [Dactylosporangium sp. NBC_01737]
MGVDVDELATMRGELVGYCYRMLGSAFEADDAVQETMVRAWRRGDAFEGRSSVRAWVYRIATNVCVDLLRERRRRAVPMDLGPASTAAAFLGASGSPEQPWLTPLPTDPGDAAAARDTVRLAFVAALQHLPVRQRAVLILRDVLTWSAAETAGLLGVSVGAVNAMLLRARATLDARQGRDRRHGELSDDDRRLLSRYVDAFERYDVDALVGLLHEDAVQSMPPYTLWLRGAAEIGRFLRGPGAECAGSILVPVQANGAAAFGQYRNHGDRHLPWAIQVLEVGHGRVTGLHSFLDTELFPIFGLPTVYFAGARSSYRYG